MREIQINFSILTALFDTTGYGLPLKYLKILLGLTDLDLDRFKSHLSLIFNHSHFFFPRPVNMLGSPRKHKTLTHALQDLHTALSVDAIVCNQNSNYYLSSIQI